MNFNRGQVLNGVMIGAILASSGLTWIGNYVLNSPAQAAEALNKTNERVASLEADNKTMREWLARVESKLDVVIKEAK